MKVESRGTENLDCSNVLDSTIEDLDSVDRWRISIFRFSSVDHRILLEFDINVEDLGRQQEMRSRLCDRAEVGEGFIGRDEKSVKEGALLKRKKELGQRGGESLCRFVYVIENLVNEFSREGSKAILRREKREP